jgi:hypothetical protein
MLLWWAKGTPLPPLVTTSPPGTDPTLDNPNTRILFGDELGADNVQFGWRVAAGVWLDEAHNSAAGARFWMLGGDTSQFSATSDGSPIIGRPFFDAQLGVQDSLLVASEGISRGSIHARLAQQNTIGAEGFVEWMVDRNCCRRIDVLLGYQFLRLDDWLEIINDTTDELIIPGTFFEVTDRFSTQNEFHGAEIGMRGRWASGCWSLDALGKIGAGNMRQQVTISGRTDVTFLGNTATNNTGLLAQATNIGTYERDRFVVVPELTVNLKYHATRNLSFHVGYNLIWISEVALSGEQIDLVVNPAPQLGGPLRPAFDFADDDYWLQGINFGMNWDY